MNTLEKEALEAQRKEQQGLGRPIIFYEENGYPVVMAGRTKVVIRNGKTFHDFLLLYATIILAKVWDVAEILTILPQPAESMHPILAWHKKIYECHVRTNNPENKVYPKALTILEILYFEFFYNLYTIEHNNNEIPVEYFSKIKSPEYFLSVYHEIFVAASFIRAGFTVIFEDEDDNSSTHPEFFAISPSGKKYWVEAKQVNRRLTNSENSENSQFSLKEHDEAVIAQIRKALKKKVSSKHKDAIRVVVIGDMCEGEGLESGDLKEKGVEAIEAIREAEKSTLKSLPPAYIIIVNDAFLGSMDKLNSRKTIFLDGFNIDDFKREASSMDFMKETEMEHADMHALMKSLDKHFEPPSTFNGQRPEDYFNLEVDPLSSKIKEASLDM